MDLHFNMKMVEGYHSNSQQARVLTETWVGANMYCPRCGYAHIDQYENNRPVADFYCPVCNNQYELKSKNGIFTNKINDGAYATMIERITSNKNPDFFFMSYSKVSLSVNELIFVPKYFFVPDIIEKRKPLATTARRAGWIGCNILIDKIPEQGRIPIVSAGTVCNIGSVLHKVKSSAKLEISDINNRGWLLDILQCVNAIDSNIFTLSSVYLFEGELAKKHPNNKNIRAKIRQQLQNLRDRGVITFLGNGRYQKKPVR